MAAIAPLSSLRGAAKSAPDSPASSGKDPRAVRAQRLDASHIRLPGQRLEQDSVLRPDDGDSRLRIAQVILDFVGRVRDIDGHEHRTQAQTCDVKKNRLGGFVDLNCNPVAALHTAPLERSGNAPGLLAVAPHS